MGLRKNKMLKVYSYQRAAFYRLNLRLKFERKIWINNYMHTHEVKQKQKCRYLIHEHLFLFRSVLLFFLILCVVVLCLVYPGHVSCVLNVASFSGLSILDCPFSFL
jgi:hypothetical protein